ncbi:hypothetical protein EJB05_45457 [Eragrostis curvula]|uniref:Uncharacterized protein n=1 Tax=Eragrostis curvula TaxID=38414 RepID=A0A5J9TLR8_9POAL|nr:hypothetical protein EJB05_45457 [Eragrostis curvula]
MAASAAGGESQKQLLSIIRDFASEKSHDERRVSDLRRRLADSRAAADAALEELDAAKRAREEAEQELRGSQVQAAIAAASIQALEATMARLQEEISKVGSDLDALKVRIPEIDEFIRQMHEMNTKIREFQQMVSQELAEDSCSGLQSAEGQHISDKRKTVDSDSILIDLTDKVSTFEAEVQLLEGEYKNDLLVHDKIRQELADTQAKRALMEAFMGDMKQVQKLGGYPCIFARAVSTTRSAELDKERTSLAEELQQRYTCPGCGVNNMAGLEEAAN